MLLTIDVGNTNTVLGVFDGARLVHMWRLQTDSSATVDEVRLQLWALLAAEGLEGAALEGFSLGTVVPALKRVWREVGADLGIPVLVVDAEATSELLDISAYESVPGADRIADAIAARELYGAPCIVLDLGTATNIEVVDAQGRFAGGVIAPGIQASARALSSGTALLPQVELAAPPRAIGRSTVEAMQVGVVFGQLDAIDGLVARIRIELGAPDCPVIATGGFGRLLGELSSSVTHVNPALTLDGLRMVWEAR